MWGGEGVVGWGKWKGGRGNRGRRRQDLLNLKSSLLKYVCWFLRRSGIRFFTRPRPHLTRPLSKVKSDLGPT